MLGKRILLISVILVSVFAIAAFAVVLPFTLFLDANGVVNDDAGSPVSGATVVISSPNPQNTKCFLQGTTTVATDANGHYSLTPRLDIWRADLTCQIDLTVSSPGYIGQTTTTIISATPDQNGQTWPIPQDFVIVSLTSPPLITNVIANPASPTAYVPNQVYTFSADVTDGRGIQSVTFEFDVNTYTYTNDSISNDELTLVGNTYRMILNDLPANPSGYVYRWSATDVDSNDATTPDYTYIINTTVDAAFSFTVNPPSPITYGTMTTAICTIGGTEQIPEITRDGSDVSNENGIAIILPVNTIGYAYQCELAESENYTAQSSPVITYIVNRTNPVDPSNPIIHLSLNGIENNQTIVYGTSSTALGWTTGGDEGAITTLTRDGFDVSSENGVAETLPAGTYTYEYFYEESENYTAGSVTRTLTINQASSMLDLIVNPPTPTTYGTSVTATCSIANTEQTVTLLLDGSDITTENGLPLDLAAGNYTFDCNVAETENYTANAVAPVSYTISKATPVLQLDADPAWTVVYPQSIMVTASETNNGDSDLIYELLKDGNPVTSPDNTSGFGSYTYEYRTTGGENYTINSVTAVANITKAAPILSLTFNPVSPNTYGNPTTVTCTVNNSEQVPALFRDGVDVSAENGVSTILPAGTFNYLCNVSESVNYLDATIGPQTYVVNGADPTNQMIHLALNGVEGNLTIFLGNQSNASAWKNIADGTLTLYLEGTALGTLEDIQTLPLGIYNYTVELTGAQNYTDASITRIFTVSDGTPPQITITAPLSGEYTGNETWLNATTDESATCYFGPATNPTDLMGAGTSFSTYLTGLPTGPNTYYVRCADVFGNQNETSVTWTVSSEYIIDVTMGWNLISLPIIPINPILTSDPLWGTNYIIQHYDALSGTWLEYNSTNAGAANLTEVVPDQGYWVYVDTDRTLIFLGDAPGIRTVNLYTGTNMIGWTSLTSKRMDLALWFIKDNVTSVECQDTTDMFVQALRTCNISSEYFEPAKGYFVNVTNDTTWEYPRNIPPVANAGPDQNINAGTATLDGSGSYDLDGNITSYSWTWNGLTKTGVNPTFTFNAAGSFLVKLTVTDNEGATGADEVLINVAGVPQSSSSSSIGHDPIKTSGFIRISLSAPTTLNVVRGQPTTFTATATNVGNAELFDVTLSANPAWIAITPGVVSRLDPGQSQAFTVTLSPSVDIVGTKYMTLTASGTHPNATASSSVTIEIRGIPEQCANCSQPTVWTTCSVNGTRTRTVYTCNEANGYQCVETTEVEDCSGITGYIIFITEHPVISGLIGIFIISIIAGGFYYSRNKDKVNSKIGAIAAKIRPGKKEQKPQGIDFSIEYKKSSDTPGPSGLM